MADWVEGVSFVERVAGGAGLEVDGEVELEALGFAPF